VVCIMLIHRGNYIEDDRLTVTDEFNGCGRKRSWPI
jgi:hypothetical protein